MGKSSLLNSIAGKMISIVEPTAGVTRDRVSTIVETGDRFFELIDTGGYGIVDSDELSDHVESQILQAISTADLALFVVDIRDGILPLDTKIAQMMRKNDLKTLLVANKADSPKQPGGAGEFLRLGFGEPICVSATNFINKAVLLERVVEELEHLPKEVHKKEEMKIAVVGKRNAGKSTFINALVGENRVIVSDVPGTTRDAIDVRFSYNDKPCMIIDTAGVRKIRKMESDIEFYGYVRAARSIKRADVVLFMIDATLPISQVDKKLAALINDDNTACIMVINKWDLAKDRADVDDYEEYLDEMMPQLRHAPIAFTTATEGKNIQSVLDLTTEIFKQASTQIPTAHLNKAIEEIAMAKTGKTKKGVPKIYYATQVAVRPISLLLFVNNPSMFDDSFKRFAVNKIREILSLEEVPIRLMMRKRRG